MDIYQIRYFLAVVDAGNFSRAAERVHVTQPTLSTGIKKLEEELGIALFERSNREVKLTAAGKQFVNRARSVYRELEQAKNEIQAIRTQPVLRLGVLKTLPMETVASLVHAFRQAQPEVFLELTDGTDEDIRGRLRLNQIDLAITVLRVEDKANNSQIFTEESLSLAVSSNHPLAKRQSVTLSELDRLPLIGRINCEIWAELLEELNRFGVRIQVVSRAENDQSVITLVAVGQGVSIMPVRPNAHGVQFIPIEQLALTRRIGLVWEEGIHPKSVELFCRFVQAGVEE